MSEKPVLYIVGNVYWVSFPSRPHTLDGEATSHTPNTPEGPPGGASPQPLKMRHSSIASEPNDEISTLDELMPEEVTADAQAYREALHDPTGPGTHEYALKVAQRAYSDIQAGQAKPLHLAPSETESLRRDLKQASQRHRELIATDKARNDSKEPSNNSPEQRPINENALRVLNKIQANRKAGHRPVRRKSAQPMARNIRKLDNEGNQ